MPRHSHRSLIALLLALLSCSTLLPGASAQQAIPQPERSKRLGMNFVPPAQPWLNRARELGVYASRWQLNWQDVEPQQDNWTWDWADSELYRIVEEGELEAHLVLTLPPAWARQPGTLVPKNLYLPWDDPQNFWARYVREAVGRTGDRPVRYFEIWNEPDWDQYWQGSPADYYQLLKVSYRAVKATNPKAKVIMAGMSYWHDPSFWEQVLELAAKDPEGPANNYFFDIAAFHWYSRSELLYEKVTWARDTLRRYGMDKPIYVNEVNVPLWGVGPGPSSPRPGYANAEEQAAFIIQAHANALAAGAERLFFFRMSDDQMAEAFGLMRNDAKRGEAFNAYKLMANYLGDAKPEGRVVENGVVKVTFWRDDRARVTVLWNQTPQAVEATVVPATGADGSPLPGARLIDQAGAITPLQPVEGVYRATLPGATNRGDLGPNDYAIGGRTYLLVEGVSSPPPVSTMEPLPELASSRTFDVRWSAEDRSGMGIAGYDVQVRRGDGNWQAWLTGTPDTHAAFTGEEGARYAFRVRARDAADQVEAWRDTADTQTALLGTLAGSVRSVADDPVVGAEVCLAGECVKTGDSGGFQFGARTPGVYELTVRRPASGTSQGDPPQAAGEVHQSVRVVLGAPDPVLVRLLPAGNLIPNGDFSGPAAPGQRIDQDATGNRRAALMFDPRGSPTRRLSYVVYVPPELAHPTLSFDYVVTGTGGQFTAGVYRDVDNRYAPIANQAFPTSVRQHRELDLTPYRGRYIDIEFAVHREDQSSSLAVFVDNVVVAEAGRFRLFFPEVARQ